MKQVYLLAMLFINSVVFAQSPGEQIAQLKINFNQQEPRQVVELESEYIKANICNLVPGETYAMSGAFLSKDNPCSFKIGTSLSSFSPFILFVADDSCEEFYFHRGCDEATLAYLSLTCSSCAKPPKGYSPEQGVVTSGYSGDLHDIVTQNFIGGDCFDISNVTFTGNQGSQLGTFTNGMGAMGLDEGIILSTGDVTLAQGPNSSGDTGLDQNSSDSDMELSQLTNTSLYDKAVLEFDFVPTTSVVNFDFVFGSEEYCEFVDAGYNDVFGFFISGPGYAGPTNIALIPETTTPIAIDDVNDFDNADYFVGNSYSCNTSGSNDNIEYDGFTTVLTAEAVIYDTECATYHLKIAIADVGDGIYDSGVFLGKGSFNAGANVSVFASDYISGYNETTEGCGNAYFRFELLESHDEPVTITFSIGGSAEEGTDFDWLPHSIVINPGETFVDLPVDIFADGLFEGQEFIELVVDGGSCSCVNPQNILYIVDAPPLQVNTEDFIVCEGSGAVDLLPNVVGTDPFSYEWSTGETGPSISVSTIAGLETYMVTVTDDCGGEEIGTFMVESTEMPTAEISGDASICAGNSVDINLVLTGSGPWSVDIVKDGDFWGTLVFTEPVTTFSVSEPGEYAISSVATGDGPCYGSGLGTAIVEESSFQVSGIVIDESCPGANDGSIEVNTPAGEYSYDWSPAQSDSSRIDNLSAGIYGLTITSESGCTSEETYTIDGVSDFEVNSIIVGVDCTNPNAGSISLSVSGATPDYSFLWEDASTAQSLENLEEGIYICTITDAMGCEFVDSVHVPAVGGFPAINVEPALIIDCNNMVISLSGNGSSEGDDIVYNWETSDGNIVDGVNSLSPDVDMAGTYVFTVTNSLGCSVDTSITVLANLLEPVANVNALGQLDCNTTTLELEDNGSSSGNDFSYVWTTDDGHIQSGETTLTPTVNMSGSYTLVVTDATNGCTADVEVIVGIDTLPPLVSILLPGELTCVDSTMVLAGTGTSTGSNFDYSWTTADGGIISGETTLSPLVNELGTYHLVVTNNANGCTNSASVAVSGNFDEAIPDAGDPSMIGCIQTTAILNGSLLPNDAAFEWVTINGNFESGITTLAPVVNSEGEYTLIATHPVSGCTSESTVSISVDQNVPMADAGETDDITCLQPSFLLDGTNSSQGSNYLYSWTSSDGNILSGGTTLNPVINHEGNYQLIVTDTTNGCTALSTVEIGLNTQEPLVDAGAPSMINCNNYTLILGPLAPSGNPNLLYTWTTEDGTIVSGSTDENPTINTKGTYVVVVTDIVNGCTAADQVVIGEDLEVPSISLAGNDEITCTINSVSIVATPTNVANPIFEWTTIDGNVQQGNETSTIVADKAGTYVVSVTNTENGCIAVDSFAVTTNAVFPEAIALEPGVLTCQTDSVHIFGTGSSTGSEFVYSWSTVDGHIVSESNILDILVNEPGAYTLGVTNVTNNCASTYTIDVSQDIEPPSVDAGTTQTLLCGVDSLQLSGLGSANSGNVDYLWTTELGSILSGNTTANPFVDAPGAYYLHVVNSSNGCTALDSVMVDQDINIPTVDAGGDATINCQVVTIELGTTNTSTGADFSYHWTTQNGVLPAVSNTPFITITDGGTYELEVMNTTNGCKAVSVVVIDEDKNKPIIDPGLPSELNCYVDSVLIGGDATSAGAQFTYQWTTLGGSIISLSDVSQILVNEPGDYHIVVTNTENFCESEHTIAVSQDVTSPVIVVGPADMITCSSPSVSLSGNGSSMGTNFEYVWASLLGNIVSGETSLTPVVNQPGVYTLLIQNTTNGCTSIDSVEVLKDDSQPTAQIEPVANLTCKTHDLELDASSSSAGDNYEYHWTTTNGNIINGVDSIILAVNQAGDYHLVVLDLTNNCTSYADITVEVDTVAPLVEAGANAIINCGDSILTLDGFGTSIGGEYTYQWTTANGNILSGSQSLNPIINQVGTYSLAIENLENGCQSVDSVIVVADVNAPVIVVASTPVLTCDILEVTIDATNSSGGVDYLYSWSTQNGHILSGAKTDGPVVDKKGKYLLKLTNSQNGCTSTKEVTVEEDIEEPVIEGHVNGTLTCKDTNAEINVTATGSGNDFDFYWATLNGSIVSGSLTSDVVVDSSGFYTLVVKDLGNGCSSEKPFEVIENRVLPDLLAPIPDTLSCKKTTVSLGAISNKDVNFEWLALSGNIMSGEMTASPIVNEIGTYQVVITDKENGCTSTEVVQVTENMAKPIADAGEDFDIPCTSNSVQIGPLNVNSNYFYSWNSAAGGIVSGANSANPIVSQVGVYQLVVEDKTSGCTEHDDVLVTAPPQIVDLSFDIDDVTCKGLDGAIVITNVLGGSSPYLFSFDNGHSFSALDKKESLPSGTYKVIVQDINGCEYEDFATVPTVAVPVVQTENLFFIELGDSLQLQLFTSLAASEIDTIIWDPIEALSCTNCLNPVASPKISIQYGVTIIDKNGCDAFAKISIYVSDPDVFIPNVFSPNSDNLENSSFFIQSELGKVKEITSLFIVDRWGNMLFEKENFQPNDPYSGWDGSYKGDILDPGVFVYHAIIEFVSGKKVSYSGDVTIVR